MDAIQVAAALAIPRVLVAVRDIAVGDVNNHVKGAVLEHV